jgi:signal transduction histidine kinase
MLLLRADGGGYFDQADLMTAESFASQAAVVLVLGEARHADDVKSLFDERERIARDLHDLAVQQLFATGMRLETARRQVTEGGSARELENIISDALDNVDAAVREIRSIIHDLRDPDAAAGLAERLRRESSLARAGLGFAPSLVILVDGQALEAPGSSPELGERLDRLVGQDLADDVVAVAREGLANAARHAKASSVRVTISVDCAATAAGRVQVEVADDGRGMPQDGHRRSGLANLEARARRHGGALEIKANQPAPGITLTWRVTL